MLKNVVSNFENDGVICHWNIEGFVCIVSEEAELNVCFETMVDQVVSGGL